MEHSIAKTEKDLREAILKIRTRVGSEDDPLGTNEVVLEAMVEAYMWAIEGALETFGHKIEILSLRRHSKLHSPKAYRKEHYRWIAKKACKELRTKGDFTPTVDWIADFVEGFYS